MRLLPAMLITLFLASSGAYSQERAGVRAPRTASEYTEIQAVVLSQTRLQCPHARVTLRVTRSSNPRVLNLQGTTRNITAESFFWTTAGRIETCDRRNVGAMAAFYLLPGDEINAKIFPGVARVGGSTQWFIYGISRRTAIPPRPIARGARTVDGIEVALELEPTEFDFGEHVPLVLAVRNTTAQTKTLQFSSGQQFDFAITRARIEIWRWSRDRFFTQALTSVTLAPGETVRFTESWPQRDNTDRQVVFGSYQIIGSLPTMQPPRPETAPVTITIRPR